MRFNRFQLKALILFSLFGNQISSKGQDTKVVEKENVQDLLDDTPVGDHQFVPLLLQHQRYLYKVESWDRFFANAIFYRLQILSKEPSDPKQYNQILIALEMMALAKHCLYEQANKIGASTLFLFKKKNVPSEKIEEASELVDLHSSFPSQAKPKAYSKTPRNSFSSEFYWPFERQHLKWMSHPSIFRVIVKPQCQD
jgi:hypothetical protein